MAYQIWCKVSGGITGTRESWLKDGDTIAQFDSFAAAQDHADYLTNKMNHSLARAYFSYRPCDTTNRFSDPAYMKREREINRAQNSIRRNVK